MTDTLVIKINPDDPTPEILALAGDVLRAGELVAFPTETVYGLGANALNADAVTGIFTAKQRPANDPVIVHLYDADQLPEIAQAIPDSAYELARLFWPGALTLVLKRASVVPDVVTAGQDTVAVRVPSHPVARLLLQESGLPIAAPSANRFSRPSPTSAEHVLTDLDGRISLLLDGGTATIGVESTIIDLTGNTPRLLRPGGVALEALRDILPDIAYQPLYHHMDAIAPSPGTLVKHYSPSAEVLVYEGQRNAVTAAMHAAIDQYRLEGLSVGVLARDDEAADFTESGAIVETLGADDAAIAAHLFAGIRALDQVPVDTILVRAPERTGVGLAVWDRLVRAAEGRIIEVHES